jgi:hypothetical protein
VVDAVIEVDGSTGEVVSRHAASNGLMLTGLVATAGGAIVADGLHGLLLRLP